ncbi:MAG: VWA domain-containing protein [Phycisphaerae bacterium]
MRTRQARGDRRERRGVVVVQALIMATVLLGCAALSIDVGAIYNAKADLQVVADGAALAAAEVLSTNDAALSDALQTAQDIAARNRVYGHESAFMLEPGDVEFIHASMGDDGRYQFSTNHTSVNAVRVTARLKNGHSNGPLDLIFADIFGRLTTDLHAEAVAVLGPRDIAIVADLSASHNDDSELRKYRETDINLFEVWDALPVSAGRSSVGNGIDPPPQGIPGSPGPAPGIGPGRPGGSPDPGTDPVGGQRGPTWGWMYYWGKRIDDDYDPVADPGLMYFPRYKNWNNPDLEQWYRTVGYSDREISALMSRTYDGNRDSWGEYAWTNRVAVALGLARWDSGLPDGLWKSIPPEKRKRGNGNNWMSASELTWLVDYPFDRGSWSDYIYRYVGSTTNRLYKANKHFRYRFGVKTFTNYLLERRPGNNETAMLALTPHQPMDSVRNAVGHMMDTIEALDNQDHVSLEVYGRTVAHEVDLGSSTASANPHATGVVTTEYPSNYAAVAGRLNEMQAGHYDRYTNMGGGLERAIETLTGPNARENARKIIILLTDGIANVDDRGRIGSAAAKQYARNQAYIAASHGIKLYTVSVGSGADTAFMEELADIANEGGGQNSFFAGADPSTYPTELAAIFRLLGSRREVELVQ